MYAEFQYEGRKIDLPYFDNMICNQIKEKIFKKTYFLQLIDKTE